MLKQKQRYTEKLLGDFGRVQPIIGMERPLFYRNKVHHVISRDKKGNILNGMYEEDSHKVVNAEKCMVEDEQCQAIIETVVGLLKSFKIFVYNKDNETGLLRHVLVRKGFTTGEVMVVLVVASPIFPSKNYFVKALRKVHPEITTVVLNVNDKRTSMVLGARNITLYGQGYIKDVLCGLTFRISPSSFYQINPVQTEKLYRAAIDMAALTGNETVIDAYCGIGTIVMVAAAKAQKVIVVELNPEAVKDALINKRENNIKNVEFYQGDAGEFMTKMAAGGEKAQVVLMDPPRSGSTEQFMDAIKVLSPEKVVYVSCNPETQARDLKYFNKLGYKVRQILPVDMFPYTGHVEMVVLLSKGEIPSKKVKVEFSLEGMDTDGFKDGATYDEIRDWVQEKYGIHVTNLNIAQIKRKNGIIERENYNKPKSEDSRQPETTPEKEKAEMDVWYELNR